VQSPKRSNRPTRREFLAALIGLTAGALTACRPQERVTPTVPFTPTPTSIPTAISTATRWPTATLTATQTPRPSSTSTATGTPSPTRTSEPTPTNTVVPTSTPAPKALVAVARCPDYSRAVEARVREMVHELGGLSDVIKPGATVIIKPNLTAGGNAGRVDGHPPNETYTTHPAVVRAIGLLCQEAGAGRIVLAEGWGLESFPRNGYEEVIRELGAETVNLDVSDPYEDFVQVPVGEGWQVYEWFYMHPILTEADVLISVAKLKCHASAGVTLSLKNLFGCPPLSRYKEHPEDSARSALHAGDWPTRLPRIIVDLAQALPIHFSLIDGVMSLDAGEGPWNASQSGDLLKAISPGVLIASRNPVAADAIATAIMGFDPTAGRGESAFLNSDNHIMLAAERGLGTCWPDEIGILGEPIEAVRFLFHAVPKYAASRGVRGGTFATGYGVECGPARALLDGTEISKDHFDSGTGLPDISRRDKCAGLHANTAPRLRDSSSTLAADRRSSRTHPHRCRNRRQPV